METQSEPEYRSKNELSRQKLKGLKSQKYTTNRQPTQLLGLAYSKYKAYNAAGRG